MLTGLALVNDLARTQDQRVDLRPKHLRDLPAATSTQWRYWRLLYEVRRSFPYAILPALDVGTAKGTSALHLAAGAHALVPTTSVDINPAAGEHVRTLSAAGTHYPDLQLVTADSLEHEGGRYGVVFLDGLHGFDRAYAEYLKYRTAGGLIFFDDLHLHAGMEAMWSCIHEPKIRLDSMHYTGFGVVEAVADFQPLDWLAARWHAALWCKRIVDAGELDRAEC